MTRTRDGKGSPQHGTKPGQEMPKVAPFLSDGDRDRGQIVDKIHTCVPQSPETSVVVFNISHMPASSHFHTPDCPLEHPQWNVPGQLRSRDVIGVSYSVTENWLVAKTRPLMYRYSVGTTCTWHEPVSFLLSHMCVVTSRRSFN